MNQIDASSFKLGQSLNVDFYTSESNGSTVEYQWHSALEIILIQSGKLTIETDKHTYDLRRNDLLIIDCNCAHSSRSTTHYKALILKIPQNILTDLIPNFNTLSFAAPLNLNNKKQITRKLCQLQNSLDTQLQGYKVQFSIYLFELIKDLYLRCAVPAEKPPINIRPENHEKIQAVITYIQNNYSKPIELETLSSMCSFQKNYFCRFFKKNLGITCYEYIENIRFCRMCQDLVNSNETIEVLMKKNGFTSYELFIKLFKRKVCMTATTYRKTMKKLQN